MLRIPVRGRNVSKIYISTRLHSSSGIRSTFIEFFKEKHSHKVIKSSPVVPLCDPTVPFVNAGMNQFKGVFLGNLQPPAPRAVNSQKCIRVGGKHNDLDVVGTDGTHHTFFEMLGNWSFGDYYKKEACEMAWELLTGPYGLKPENLLVTYFNGDVVLGLTEDRECRDIWKDIGVSPDRLRGVGAKDNFWEMAATGPCGPCTEVHHINEDGSLTEIWNIVFIQCNRVSETSVQKLSNHFVDTGLGLERLTSLLQRVPSNYDTDLFKPIIRAIEKESKSGPYSTGSLAAVWYRRLADHARMISVCLADGAYPATSVNLKQVIRRSLKLSSSLGCGEGLLGRLYDEVAGTLAEPYPEIGLRSKESKLILAHEEDAYKKLRSSMNKKWKVLQEKHPEVESMADVELAGFAQGYAEFKDTMSKVNTPVIPGELVFKLYDTHGFQEDIIERVAKLNNMTIDKEKFWKLLSEHKQKHKAAFREQTDRKGFLFNEAIKNINENGVKRTDDSHKYNYTVKDNKIEFEPVRTKLVALLNEKAEWIDYSEPAEDATYYVATEDTNFYCEEGGQSADTGVIVFRENIKFIVESVFKIRDIVFYKGHFEIQRSDFNYVNGESDCTVVIDSEKRLKVMQNHTTVHLLNSALRKVLPNSCMCQIGSSVTENGFTLNLSLYGEKLSQKVVCDAQELVRKTIKCDVPVRTSVLNSVELSNVDSVLTVPGETYPEVGLRVVEAEADGLLSRELCCGTHLPSTGFVEDFCVTLVKGAGSNTPVIHAITGEDAKEARELFCRTEKLGHVIQLIDEGRMKEEADHIKERLSTLCGGSGAPFADLANCLNSLEKLTKQAKNNPDVHLHAIAEAEVKELSAQLQSSGAPFMVHFLRCSYLCDSAPLRPAAAAATLPALLLGCANGVIHAAAVVPQDRQTKQFTASKWLSCILPVFKAEIVAPMAGQSTDSLAEMTGTKVSLITCEQLVQDAMRVAIKYAQLHANNEKRGDDHKADRQNRRTN